MDRAPDGWKLPSLSFFSWSLLVFFGWGGAWSFCHVHFSLLWVLALLLYVVCLWIVLPATAATPTIPVTSRQKCCTSPSVVFGANMSQHGKRVKRDVKPCFPFNDNIVWVWAKKWQILCKESFSRSLKNSGVARCCRISFHFSSLLQPRLVNLWRSAALSAPIHRCLSPHLSPCTVTRSRRDCLSLI